jgi:glycosyltransferase involved in cell wall biosynthesis
MVRLCSAGLVGGKSHADYVARLGMARDRIFLGYDVVDNAYFAAEAAKWRKQNAESGKQKAPASGQWSVVSGQKSDVTTQVSVFQNDLRPLTADRCPPPPTPYFLASARFVEKKNLPRLIQAYALYRKKSEVRPQKSDLRPPTSDLWSLVLLGDGPFRPDLCSLISDLSLQDSVLLPGFKQYNELPAYYAHAGAFVHASTTEQWGLVVNEAMASGLPVIVSNRCGCAAELVHEGVNGFAFDPYNVEQLAQLMLKISAFNFPLSAFGSESQRLISSWGPERFARGLRDACQVAVSAPPPRPNLFDRLLLRALLMRRTG